MSHKYHRTNEGQDTILVSSWTEWGEDILPDFLGNTPQIEKIAIHFAVMARTIDFTVHDVLCNLIRIRKKGGRIKLTDE